MKRTVSWFCAAVLCLLPLFPAVAAAPDPATDEPAAVTAARTRTRAICTGLVRGDPSPLLMFAAESPMRIVAQNHLHTLQRLVPDDRKKPLRLDLEHWRNALAHENTTMKGGSCVITAPRAHGPTLVLTARFEVHGLPRYWRFLYRVSNTMPALESIDLPFAGMTLAASIAERLFFTAYADAAPERPVKSQKPDTWRNVLILIAVLFAIALLFQRRQKAPRARDLLRNRRVIFAVAVFIALALWLIISRSHRLAPAKPETLDAPARRRRSFERRLLLHLHMTRGRYARAETLAADLLSAHPDRKDPTVQLQLLQALISQKKTDHALPRLRAMTSANEAPARAFAYDRLAMLAMDAGRYDDAARHLLHLRKIIGEDDDVLARIAHALDNAGQKPEAQKALARALQAHPLNSRALFLRARWAMRVNDLDAAAADLRTLKKNYGLNVILLQRDEDFSKLKKHRQYADLFAND